MRDDRRWTVTICGYDGSVCEPVCDEPCPGTTEVEVMPVSPVVPVAVLRGELERRKATMQRRLSDYDQGREDQLDSLSHWLDWYEGATE